jgi:hypothetical protein
MLLPDLTRLALVAEKYLVSSGQESDSWRSMAVTVKAFAYKQSSYNVTEDPSRLEGGVQSHLGIDSFGKWGPRNYIACSFNLHIHMIIAVGIRTLHLPAGTQSLHIVKVSG